MEVRGPIWHLTQTPPRKNVRHVVETASLGIDVRSVVPEDELEDRANEILDTARETVRGASIKDITTSAAYGRSSLEILTYVEENDIDVDMFGMNYFSRYTLGSVSAN